MIPQLHDEAAYSIVNDIVDFAEARLVAKGICRREQAQRCLTLDYIATASGAVQNAVLYSENDERIGADMFLAKLPIGQLKPLYHRNRKRCAAHLASKPSLHFPDYEPILRVAFLHVMRTIDDVRELRFNGVALLACGTFLDSAITDLRRECRRRGLSYEPTFVNDATKAKRIDDRHWYVRQIEFDAS
jgi:hypothetical protein